MKSAKLLSIGIALMGLVHVIATFTPVIAGKLGALDESARRAFIYMSLMCGALLVVGGVLSCLLAGQVKKHPFLRPPCFLVVSALAMDGVLAAIMMPHNPCAWVVLALGLPLLLLHLVELGRKLPENGTLEIAASTSPHPRFVFNTVGLFTTDNAKMVAFYRDVFGFQTEWNGKEPNVEMHLAGSRLIMFSRREFEGMTSRQYSYPQGINGTMELSMDVPTFADVDHEYAAAINKGAAGIFPPTTEPWGQRTCYVADPEGNLIEISSFVESAAEC